MSQLLTKGFLSLDRDMAKVVVACGAHVSDEKTRSCDHRTYQ